MNIFYSPTYNSPDTDFDTMRKAGWVAESLVTAPIAGVHFMTPLRAQEHELKRVHTEKYVRAVRTGAPEVLASTSGFPWTPATWNAVAASTGGMIEAAMDAWKTKHNTGSLSSGLHHARADHGSGFCTFNGLALAADGVVQRGARKVLILDVDAHCGGGTYSLVKDMPGVTHWDLSVSDLDSYVVPVSAPLACDDPAALAQWSTRKRHRLHVVKSITEYLPTLLDWLHDIKVGEFDLLIYNAGMDPHENDMMGGMTGISNATLLVREHLVFKRAADLGLPVAFALAGGYTSEEHTRQTVVNLHRLTISAAAAPLQGPYALATSACGMEGKYAP